MNSDRRTFVALGGLLALVVLALSTMLWDTSTQPTVGARVGDPQALRIAYQRWKTEYSRSGGERTLVMALGYNRGLSVRFVKAQGQVTLDLAHGTVDVRVAGLPAREAFDVWLVDNRPGPGRTVRPEPGDGLLRVGRLRASGEVSSLRTQLSQTSLSGFKIDLVVVAGADQDPGQAGILFGAPSLFQRLYYAELRRPVTAPAPARPATGFAPFTVLVPTAAWADEAADDLARLVARGGDLFFNETFAGNGRTCGTCHPVENNFTIDPKFIATLPPNDPLFVAETNPDLAQNFENPVLMRQFGLILENVDGFANPGVMRGVPHTLALPTSLTPPGFLFDGTTRPPFQRTGWSGDGAPNGGTLRDFAVGAVTQHFTLTLNRVAGVDFRLPTDEELDAMEAFQLSLGRQTELNLATMLFRGPTVEQGKQLFLTAGKCNTCHANAGANLPGGGNANFDTGVENLPHPADALSPPQPRPRDAGFGGAPHAGGGFGNGTFNTPPLIEAADTGPFFHNNAVATLEEAVAFYTTASFAGSPSGAFVASLPPLGPIVLAPEEVNAIGALLRVLNALENIRSASAALNDARLADLQDGRSLLAFSMTETDDAIRVLVERGLHPNAVQHLRNARAFEVTASLVPLAGVRNLLMRQALVEQKAAQADLVR